MLTTRRDFLRVTSAVPLVFGLAALGCKSATPERPAGPPPAPPPSPGGPGGPASLDPRMPGWIYTSFSWIVDGQPGVVIRVPKGEADRRALGEGLIDRSARGPLDAREVFVEAVFVCLDDEAIAKYVEGAKPDENAILVEGRRSGMPLVRVDGMAFPPGDAKDPAKFAAAFRRLVHGDGDTYLKARAAEARSKAQPDVLAALDRLASEADRDQVAHSAYGLAPALVLARQEAKTPARREAIADVIVGHLDRGPMGMGYTRLPWGIDKTHSGGGCGGAGTNVACGMAQPTPGSYRFLRFLTTAE